MRRLTLVLVALVALAAGGTAALASGAKEKPRAAVAVKARAGFLQSAVTYLGIDRKTLVKELRSGKSLAQIATAHNKSVAGLETAILDAFKAKVDKAVAAGKLGSARAQTLVAAAPAVIHRLVTQAPPKVRPAKAHLRGGFLEVAADYVGLDRKALVAELRSGKSLAQVATSQNRSVAGLQTALFNAFKAKVDAAVASGKLNATLAQRLLERAPALIERVVNAHR